MILISSEYEGPASIFISTGGGGGCTTLNRRGETLTGASPASGRRGDGRVGDASRGVGIIVRGEGSIGAAPACVPAPRLEYLGSFICMRDRLGVLPKLWLISLLMPPSRKPASPTRGRRGVFIVLSVPSGEGRVP